MKDYFNNINNINQDEVYEGLLAHGLFNNKLPPFVTSKSFFEYYKVNPTINSKWRDYIRYENMRNINIPRQLAIPSPFAYAQLCLHIKEHWDKIKEHVRVNTENQSHKISRVHVRKMEHSESIFEMNYKNFEDDGWPENDLLIKSNYIVHADISNCFPSIYSHSVPWALIGKEEAKSKTAPRFKNEWYNKLDEYLRITKNGETNGVLIGPHASNLISEIILIVVDKNLYDKGYKFIRYIDDYQCYVDSIDQADKFLIDLSIELKKFELTLNHKKTEILNLPLNSEKKWLRTLKRYLFSDENDTSVKIKMREVFSYLDIALELMHEDKDSKLEILNYAIKILSSKQITTNTLNQYLNRIHHLVLIYPYLVQLLDKYLFGAFSVEKSHIKQISDDLIEYGLPRSSFEPCTYGVFFALKYDFELSIENICEKSLNSDDCIFMLITYIYCKKHDHDITPFIVKAKHYNTIRSFDNYWLFIYEVLQKEDLKDEFKLLKEAGISFIDYEVLNENISETIIDLPF